jgi:hypothetical protein
MLPKVVGRHVDVQYSLFAKVVNCLSKFLLVGYVLCRVIGDGTSPLDENGLANPGVNSGLLLRCHVSELKSGNGAMVINGPQR